MITLKYTAYRPDGIFGELSFPAESEPFCVTLSHAYQQSDMSWKPIVLPGLYDCVRGTHQLANGIPFETFEITGIDGHSGLLFHAGNFDKDSHGCTLLGDKIITQADGSWMITNSKSTFLEFMAQLDGVDKFKLQVI